MRNQQVDTTSGRSSGHKKARGTWCPGLSTNGGAASAEGQANPGLRDRQEEPSTARRQGGPLCVKRAAAATPGKVQDMRSERLRLGSGALLVGAVLIVFRYTALVGTARKAVLRHEDVEID